jgi:hypothetical protein
MMNKEEAVETVGRALVKRHGFREEMWRAQHEQATLAIDIVTALEALGIWSSNAAKRDDEGLKKLG